MLNSNRDKTAGIDFSSAKPMLKKNIFLTGFMGSGKTSVGILLADLLKVDFFDTDGLIIRDQKMSVNEIFKRYGEEFFRNRETEALRILGNKPPGTCVVSTGGGAVLREENIAAMRKNGLVVYLDVSAEEAYRRIKYKKNRPLLRVADPCKVIRELLQERRPFYRQADLEVDSSGKTVEEIAQEIFGTVVLRSGR